MIEYISKVFDGDCASETGEILASCNVFERIAVLIVFLSFMYLYFYMIKRGAVIRAMQGNLNTNLVNEKSNKSKTLESYKGQEVTNISWSNGKVTDYNIEQLNIDISNNEYEDIHGENDADFIEL